MHKKIAFVAGLGFASWNAKDVLKALSGLGYRGVEWTMSHFNPRTQSSQEIGELVRLTHEFDMEISDLVIQQDLISLDDRIRRDRVELVNESIRMAGDHGVKVINLFTGPAPWNPNAPKLGVNISQGEAWSMVYEAFDQFVPLAEKCEIHLAVEAVFEMLCKDYYTTMSLIDHYNSEYLGVVMDPSHYALYRNDIPWAVKQWGARIKHVHLKDVIGVPGTIGEAFMFPLLGEGMIDWKGFIGALAEIDYDGWLSVEFESFKYYNDVLVGDPVKAAKLSMETLEVLL